MDVKAIVIALVARVILCFGAAALVAAGFTAAAQAPQDNSTGVAPAAYADGATREKLTAPRTYSVRSDGDDANCNGKANVAYSATVAPACAVQTWPKVISIITTSIDFGGQTVTLLNGNGATYTTGIAMTQAWTGGGAIIFDLGGGMLNVPGLALSLQSFACPGLITIQNGTLQGGTGIGVSAPCRVVLGAGLTFGACSSRHMQATIAGASIEANFVSYNIAGGARSHYYAADHGRIIVGGVTVTFTANASFGTTRLDAFASAHNGGHILASLGTYSAGAFKVTGRRYYSSLAGYINATGSSVAEPGSLPKYFPGDEAGGGTHMGVSPWGLYNG